MRRFFFWRSSSHVSLDLRDPFVFHVIFGTHTGRVFMFHMQKLGARNSVPHWLDWGDSLDLFAVQPKDG
jgi:hypothetical protein